MHPQARSGVRQRGRVGLLGPLLEGTVFGFVFRDRLQDACRLGILHRMLLHDSPALDDDVNDQNDADDASNTGQERIQRHGVVVEDAVAGGVDGRLQQVHEPAEADDGAVDAAESREAKYFGGVVAHGRVVERAQQAEQDHVDVAGPHVGQRAEDADGGDEGDDDGE